jgi:glycosyltransferase involved in cell wall biosynthesis
MTPSVSVVIPVFDAARYLAEAIESVRAQSRPAEEIVVVDDGSTDDSAAVAARFAPAVRVVARVHAGIGAARNAGVAAARGTHLAFLDADDLWVPEKLARQLEVLAAEPELDLVFAHAQNFLSPDLEPAAAARLHCPAEPMPGIVPGTMLVARATLARVGPFDTAVTVGEFVDWYARARESGCRERVLPETLLLRRVHGGNTGVRARDSRQDYVRVLKAALDRRRERGSSD